MVNVHSCTCRTIDVCALATVCDTSRVMRFLDAVLSCAPEILGGRNWDQVMIAVATWIHCAYETTLGNSSKQRSSIGLSRKVCGIKSTSKTGLFLDLYSRDLSVF